MLNPHNWTNSLICSSWKSRKINILMKSPSDQKDFSSKKLGLTNPIEISIHNKKINCRERETKQCTPYKSRALAQRKNEARTEIGRNRAQRKLRSDWGRRLVKYCCTDYSVVYMYRVGGLGIIRYSDPLHRLWKILREEKKTEEHGKETSQNNEAFRTPCILDIFWLHLEHTAQSILLVDCDFDLGG